MPNKSPNTLNGFFLTLEGGEGVGKSTAIKTIANYLDKQKRDYLITREPGGTPLAEIIRNVVLKAQPEILTPTAELLLIFAARAQHVETVIEPALRAGKVVICDRFTDASFAYQGAGRGVDCAYITYLANWVHPDCWPHLTLLFDAPIELARDRILARGDPDRIEKEASDFFKRVHAAYRQRAADESKRFRIIDASLPLDNVQQTLIRILKDHPL
ncbi:MAG: dTMP kinase [Gammaproteobacteria bacterium]|nr:dTMP kinase [Gammaproteobacteria bacterium]